MTLAHNGFAQAAEIDIPQFLDFMAKKLQETANEELDNQIRLGQTVFTTAVDGRAVSSRAAIASAKRNVRINFPLSQVDLALAIMQRELERAIAQTTTRRTGKLEGSVRVWYGGNDKPTREVTGTSEIEEFLPGDFVVLYAAAPYAAYVNYAVAKSKGKGFVGRAAQRIRSAIRQKKTSAGLSIYAQHSKRIANMIGGEATKLDYGVPVIYIKWRKQEYRSL
ncbi:MAG: hypothetical protein ACO25M_09330 [Limnohabitans sp.]